MTEAFELPPEIQHVADLLSKERPDVRELFRYVLVLAMIDDEKVHLISTRLEDGRAWPAVVTLAGDVCGIVPRSLTGT